VRGGVAAMIALGTDFSAAAAIALGLPLALSSTAQVLPIAGLGPVAHAFGERTFAILLFQDLSIIPMITIIGALSRNPANADAPPGWQQALYTVLAIAGLILAGRYLIRRCSA
jgi:CPA2 family monovalent cation:H+ antiporter-2/glutathione-regulated potassium-efflux system protein KefB